MNKEARFN
jgi:hypothetical protein